MLVDEVPTKTLIGIARAADLTTAAQRMTEHGIGALGIYSADGHDLVGILTERDVTRAVAEKRDPLATRVDDVMSKRPLIAEGPLRREEALDIMRTAYVRHLVIRQDGGDRILSLRDL